MSSDFLIKGGRVIDPASGIDDLLDVAVKEGAIAAVKKNIEADEANIYHGNNCLVCPGLVDFHTHVYWGGGWGINAELIGPKTGVTTFVDAGTSGPGNFKGFLELIIKPSLLRLYAFLHIAFNGLFGAIFEPSSFRIIGELEDIRMVLFDKVLEVARRHPDIIRGIKVRASMEAAGGNALQAVRLAKQAARELGIPLTVHVGLPPAGIRDVLNLLDAGDILTHAFRGPVNSLLDRNDKIVPEGLAAKERGVFFDVAHGLASFSFESTRKLIGQGFLPDIISSDLHAYCIQGPAYDLPTTMSKLLALGLKVYDIIRAVTATPAKVLRLEDQLGNLKPGSPADITILKLEKGSFTFEDVNRETLTADIKFLPFMTFKDGNLIWSSTDATVSKQGMH